MADPNMPFAEPPAEPGADLATQWGQALQNPSTRASLMQIGLQLMQPMQFGQTAGGHIAQALGAGGEAAGRVAEEDRKAALADSRIEKDQESISQGRERLSIGNRNATTRENALKARTTGSGLSARDLFSAEGRAQNQARIQANTEAKMIMDRLRDDDYQPASKKDPTLAPYRGKSPGQIIELVMSDPGFQQRTGRMQNLSIPPVNERVVGKTYQSARGPVIWRGTGWELAKPTLSTGGLANDPEDE